MAAVVMAEVAVAMVEEAVIMEVVAVVIIAEVAVDVMAAVAAVIMEVVAGDIPVLAEPTHPEEVVAIVEAAADTMPAAGFALPAVMAQGIAQRGFRETRTATGLTRRSAAERAAGSIAQSKITPGSTSVEPRRG
jgi:hypothetical protein